MHTGPRMERAHPIPYANLHSSPATTVWYREACLPHPQISTAGNIELKHEAVDARQERRSAVEIESDRPDDIVGITSVLSRQMSSRASRQWRSRHAERRLLEITTATSEINNRLI
ncbi:unnamed protein product [Leptosia nina]|uniref:Uncharacterized protein n=1 Tax=Leptosia nina TaxID=320188 RepID=A0AAV1J3I4_9NEOP